MKPILEIDNFILSFHGPEGRVPAVKGVSLAVMPGEVLALVGESGCGKTSLCRAILGLHSAHAVAESGSIRLCGQDVTRLSEKEMEQVRGRDASLVFQDPMSSLNPTVSIGGQIVEAIRLHETISRKEAWNRAVELLRQVGIPEPERRAKQYPHHFSGGMRQRAAIAIALACSPKLFVADEPTTALDLDTQNQIIKLLESLVKSPAAEGKEKSMVFITHDLGLAEKLADRIIVMKDGNIVEEGRTSEIFADPHHEYTKKLLGFAAYGKGTSHYHGRITEPAGHHSRTSQCDGTPLVRVENLTKYFAAGRSSRWIKSAEKGVNTVLENFSMRIYKGEIVGIVGPSGCGKSTLARCMMGIHKPDGGSITYEEGCRTQMIFQDSASAFNPRMTLAEIIGEPLVIEALQAGKKPDRVLIHRKVGEIMEAVGLEKELAGRHPYDVSGGQRQRAAIARALITEPDLLIADEPVSSLDVSIQSQIIHLLKKLHEERQLTMMIIAHDLPMVEHISDRIIEMKE